MQASRPSLIHVEAGEGQAFWVGTSLVTCKAGSLETDGQYSVFESRDQPQSGPPMHIHHREDESYYILEGDYEIHRQGLPPVKAGVGAFVFVAKGTAHTYKNVAATPGRMVVITAPAGLETFFEEVGERATDTTSVPVLSGPPDLARMAAIARKHDLEIVGPPPR